MFEILDKTGLDSYNEAQLHMFKISDVGKKMYLVCEYVSLIFVTLNILIFCFTDETAFSLMGTLD